MADVPKTLHEKLLAVQQAVQYFQKANKNQQQGFNYVSSAQVCTDIRKAMDEEGLLLKSEVIDSETRLNAITTKSGGAMHWTSLTMRFTWINAANPTEREECLWYSEGLDNSEKASGKAATYGEKYFLLKFFHVPTDQDDPDAWESKGEEGHAVAPGGGGQRSAPAAASGPAPACPKCGKPMKVRTGKSGDFYGCTGYPECKGTMNIPAAPPEEDAPAEAEGAGYDDEGYPLTLAALKSWMEAPPHMVVAADLGPLRGQGAERAWGGPPEDWTKLTPAQVRELAEAIESIIGDDDLFKEGE